MQSISSPTKMPSQKLEKLNKATFKIAPHVDVYDRAEQSGNLAFFWDYEWHNPHVIKG